MSIIPKELTDEQLAEYFREYVDGCQCKERHTEAACNEVEQYDKMVAYFFPKELKPQNRLYDKMMDVAVEYEESGFMAGYRMCLKHLQEQSKLIRIIWMERLMCQRLMHILEEISRRK